MKLERITACRVCGSTALEDAIDLGPQYLQGSFAKGDIQPSHDKIPTALVRCDATANPNGCGLLQTAYNVPHDVLYTNYWYRSGTNRTMRDHLRGVVSDAIAMTGVETPSALDIGCNDGTLLSYYPKGSSRFGVDPSDVASTIGEWATVVSDIFPSEAACKAIGGRTFDVVTSIAMFYDLPDPVAFARAIRKVLSVKGVWIVEMSYLPLMLARNSFDTICHEHFEYYSLAVLERIMREADLKIVRGQLNEINGGSIRLFVTHQEQTCYDRDDWLDGLADIWDKEAELGLDGAAPYRAFQMRIEGLRDELMGLLTDIRDRGESVHIYGASTKGNTLLQWYGIDRKLIRFAADRNPSKVGARTVGTDIEIISEAASRDMKPDYYLVLPWHFRREFLEREREAIFAGTEMIFPLPHLRVVNAENYATELADAMAENDEGAGIETLHAILDAVRGGLRVIEGGEAKSRRA